MSIKNIAIFITNLLFLLTVTRTAAQSDTPEIILNEKISLSAGVGFEYSIMGLRGNYLVSERLAIMAGFSPVGILAKNKLGLSFAKAGLEYRFPDLIKSRTLMPYVSVFYGVAGFSDLSHWDRVNDIIYEENKTFFGPTFGLGTKFKIGKHNKGFGSAGLHYNYINQKTLNNFISDFNAIYGTSWINNYRRVFYSFGYTRILKSKNNISE